MQGIRDSCSASECLLPVYLFVWLVAFVFSFSWEGAMLLCFLSPIWMFLFFLAVSRMGFCESGVSLRHEQCHSYAVHDQNLRVYLHWHWIFLIQASAGGFVRRLHRRAVHLGRLRVTCLSINELRRFDIYYSVFCSSRHPFISSIRLSSPLPIYDSVHLPSALIELDSGCSSREGAFVPGAQLVRCRLTV